MPAEATLDAIELEIFKNLFVAVAEEMGVTLCRTGFSARCRWHARFFRKA
jgi:N-methylhydantoinase B/oxoprolinase/acetone carboxylase alpha subunit